MTYTGEKGGTSFSSPYLPWVLNNSVSRLLIYTPICVSIIVSDGSLNTFNGQIKCMIQNTLFYVMYLNRSRSFTALLFLSPLCMCQLRFNASSCLVCSPFSIDTLVLKMLSFFITFQ